MAKPVIELNSAGILEMLSSSEMQNVCTELGESLRQHCTAGSAPPDEFELETGVKRGRACATVRTATARAYYSNLKHNTLLKARGMVKR